MALVSITIQAHPSRRAWVDDLVAELGPDVTVAWAQPPFATANDWRAVWRTKRAALLMGLGHHAPFHAVIQDDAIVCTDFRARLEALVDRGPQPYMLFFRKKPSYPRINRLADASIDAGGFATSRGPILGPGLVFPREVIGDLIEFGDRDQGLDGDDDRIRRWVRARRHQVFIALPSLVDHRTGDSLIGHTGRRAAWRFAA